MLPALRGSEQKKEYDHPDKNASDKYGESDDNSCEHLTTHFLSVQRIQVWTVGVGALRATIRMLAGMLLYFYVPCASQGLSDKHVPDCGVVRPSVRSPW